MISTTVGEHRLKSDGVQVTTLQLSDLCLSVSASLSVAWVSSVLSEDAVGRTRVRTHSERQQYAPLVWAAFRKGLRMLISDLPRPRITVFKQQPLTNDSPAEREFRSSDQCQRVTARATDASLAAVSVASRVSVP